jgi:signal peptidase
MEKQAVMTPTVGRARPQLDRAARVLLLAAGMCLIVVLGGMASGYRALIVKSGSMAPAIQTGDVVVTKLVRPSEIRVGDVVTFRDPSRNEDLVTHRVQRIEPNGAQITFETRGDANTGVEDWDIARNGTVGRYVFRIPKIGFGLVWIAIPFARIALVAGACLVLGSVLLRAIWSRPSTKPSEVPSNVSEAV